MKGRHGQEAAHANRAAVVSKTIQSGARDAVAWASVLLALTLPLSAADAQGGNESSVHEPGYSYESLLKRIHDYDLSGAGHVIDSFIGRLPADPKPYFFFTLARWWRLAGETSSDSLQTSFLEAAGKSVEVAENYLRAHPDDREAGFFLGAGCQYISRYYFLTNSWFAACKYGRKASDISTRILEKYPGFHDANLAIGTYNYYGGRLPGLIKFLVSAVGRGGDRALGIAQLRCVANRGIYSRVDALSLLGYINLQMENDYPEAVRIFSALSSSCLSNPVFRILLANSYSKAGKYAAAISTCERALADASVNFASTNQLAAMHAELAYYYMLSGEYERAITEYGTCDSLANDYYMKELPWIYFNAGLCKERRNNFMDAESYYRMVLNCRDYFDYHSRALKAIKRVHGKF